MAAIIFCCLRGQKYHAALQLLLKLPVPLRQSLDQLPYPALVTLTVNRCSLPCCCTWPCQYSSRPLLLAQCRVQITKPGKIPACCHPAYRRQKHSRLHSAIRLSHLTSLQKRWASSECWCLPLSPLLNPHGAMICSPMLISKVGSSSPIRTRTTIMLTSIRPTRSAIKRSLSSFSVPSKTYWVPTRMVA